MSLLTKIKNWYSRKAEQWTFYQLKDDNADVHDFAARKTYLRLWVTDMFVTHDRQWFQSQAPAVNVTLKMNFSGERPARFSKVTRASDKIVTKGAFKDFEVMDLIPYNGGNVGIDASLFTVKGPNELSATIDILQGFTGLVGTPLGEVLSISKQVNEGIDKFLNVVDGDVQLAYEQTLSPQGGGGDNPLSTGYIAVVAAPLGTYKESKFEVKRSTLYYDNQPFTGKHYMLFRIEGRTHREDWSTLTNIEKTKNDAIAAILLREQEKAQTLKRATILAIYESPDLVQDDRQAIAMSVLSEFKQVEGLPQGASADDAKTDMKTLKKVYGSKPELARAPDNLEDALASLD